MTASVNPDFPTIMTQKTYNTLSNGLSFLTCGLQIIGQAALLILCLGAIYAAMFILA